MAETMIIESGASVDEKESMNPTDGVESGRDRSEGFTGTVSLQLTDLIQMVCLCRADLAIYVKSGGGSGSVFIRGGSIRHAQTEELQGEPAFYQILEWKDGHFETKPLQEENTVSITKPWEHLLLEIARRRDEESESHGFLGEEPGEILFEQDHASSTIIDFMDNAEIASAVPDDAMLPALPGATAGNGDRPGSGPDVAGEIRTVRVLIVDDSAFFARRLKDMMEAEPGMEVVGTAGNGQEALDFLADNPAVDLITLDIRMPVMKGDTTLKHIMIRFPVPVLIISGLNSGDLDKVFEFLNVGAVDFMQKPGPRDDVEVFARELRAMVKAVSRADTSHFRRLRRPRHAPVQQPSPASAVSCRDILVIAGAEGAYVDWLRLPVVELCRRGIVIGLQQICRVFTEKLLRLISESTSARVEPLPGSGPDSGSVRISPGAMFFGNPAARVSLEADLEGGSLEAVMESKQQETDRDDGLKNWLNQLCEQYKGRLSVYLLSGARALDSGAIDNVLDRGGRFILSPEDTVLCSDLVKSVEDYMLLYPEQVLRCGPEELPATWARFRSNG